MLLPVRFFVSRYVSIVSLQGYICYMIHPSSANSLKETFKQLHYLLKRETTVVSRMCELCLQEGDPLLSSLSLSSSFVVSWGHMFWIRIVLSLSDLWLALRTELITEFLKTCISLNWGEKGWANEHDVTAVLTGKQPCCVKKPVWFLKSEMTHE